MYCKLIKVRHNKQVLTKLKEKHSNSKSGVTLIEIQKLKNDDEMEIIEKVIVRVRDQEIKAALQK